MSVKKQRDMQLEWNKNYLKILLMINEFEGEGTQWKVHQVIFYLEGDCYAILKSVMAIISWA